MSKNITKIDNQTHGPSEGTIRMFTECMPNFAKIYAASDNDTMTEIISMIESIRYKAYQLSFMRNNFEEIYELSYEVDRELCGIMNKHRLRNGNVVDFIRMISVLDDYLDSALIRKLAGKSVIFSERFPEFTIKDFLDRQLSWEQMFHRKYYNEVDNPSVVDTLLDWLFDKNNEISDRNNYFEVVCDDFNNRHVYFPSLKLAEDFTAFIDSGCVYEFKDGSFCELYCF